MRCRRSVKGGRPATGFHNSESTGVLHSASWPARALEARVMRRADKQVGWGPDGWKAAALAAFIVPGASAAWSWAAPIGLELSRRSNIRGSTYFPLLGGMCGHVMSSWSSIARSRLVRVAVHPDAHFRCLGSRSPTLWAAGYTVQAGRLVVARAVGLGRPAPPRVLGAPPVHWPMAAAVRIFCPQLNLPPPSHH